MTKPVAHHRLNHREKHVANMSRPGEVLNEIELLRQNMSLTTPPPPTHTHIKIIAVCQLLKPHELVTYGHTPRVQTILV